MSSAREGREAEEALDDRRPRGPLLEGERVSLGEDDESKAERLGK